MTVNVGAGQVARTGRRRGPTVRSTCGAPTWPSPEQGHPSASRVARSILGSVKISRSSRLRVENSETIAPSAPAWNQCSVSGGTVYCSPGRSTISCHAVNVPSAGTRACWVRRGLPFRVDVHGARTAAEGLLSSLASRRTADAGAPDRSGVGTWRVPSRRPVPCLRR